MDYLRRTAREEVRCNHAEEDLDCSRAAVAGHIRAADHILLGYSHHYSLRRSSHCSTCRSESKRKSKYGRAMLSLELRLRGCF